MGFPVPTLVALADASTRCRQEKRTHGRRHGHPAAKLKAEYANQASHGEATDSKGNEYRAFLREHH